MTGPYEPGDPAARPEVAPALRGRATRGGVWLLGLRLFDQAFRVARLLILARLLDPRHFGLLGVALLALAALQTFSETGLREALVQRRGPVGPHLQTAWTVQLLRGLGLAALLWLVAPAVGGFFESPDAVPIVRWLALSFAIEGLSNVATVEFQRELRFGRQFALQATGTLVDFVVSVALALWLRDARALVFGLLAGQAAQLVAGYVLRPFLPRLRLELARARELWGFGRWMAGSAILTFLGTQGDDVVVGKLLGIGMLAYYQLAYRVASLPATEIARLVTAVLFPALSRLQEEPERLRRAWIDAVRATSFVAFPVAAALLLLAPELTGPLLGERWLPAVVPLQILAVNGLVRSIVGPGPLFVAVGRPQEKVRAQAAGLAALAIAVVPLTLAYGVAGAAWAAVLRSTVGNGWMWVRASRIAPGLGAEGSARWRRRRSRRSPRPARRWRRGRCGPTPGPRPDRGAPRPSRLSSSAPGITLAACCSTG